MATEEFTAEVTAFILVRTTAEWLGLTVDERFDAFNNDVVPAITSKVTGVRSRFYDTEAYSASVTDVWVWEAQDHRSYQLLIDALRETPFWGRYFDIVELLVGVENGYAQSYGREASASISV